MQVGFQKKKEKKKDDKTKHKHISSIFLLKASFCHVFYCLFFPCSYFQIRDNLEEIAESMRSMQSNKNSKESVVLENVVLIESLSGSKIRFLLKAFLHKKNYIFLLCLGQITFRQSAKQKKIFF